MRSFHTIGYEGATLDDFIAALIGANVATLVDVREVAISRKKGFSKRGLAAALASAGLAYAHLPRLGDPKSGRLAARAGDLAEFRAIYEAHLSAPAAQESFQALAGPIRSGGACLMCFERDPAFCHRTILARRLETEFHFRKVDLYVETSFRSRGQGARTHARQGLAAAE
jgi:uncharacterized protein (DUF488 family)